MYSNCNSASVLLLQGTNLRVPLEASGPSQLLFKNTEDSGPGLTKEQCCAFWESAFIGRTLHQVELPVGVVLGFSGLPKGHLCMRMAEHLNFMPSQKGGLKVEVKPCQAWSAVHDDHLDCG